MVVQGDDVGTLEFILEPFAHNLSARCLAERDVGVGILGRIIATGDKRQSHHQQEACQRAILFEH